MAAANVSDGSNPALLSPGSGCPEWEANRSSLLTIRDGPRYLNPVRAIDQAVIGSGEMELTFHLPKDLKVDRLTASLAANHVSPPV